MEKYEKSLLLSARIRRTEIIIGKVWQIKIHAMIRMNVLVWRAHFPHRLQWNFIFRYENIIFTVI